MTGKQLAAILALFLAMLAVLLFLALPKIGGREGNLPAAVDARDTRQAVTVDGVTVVASPGIPIDVTRAVSTDSTGPASTVAKQSSGKGAGLSTNSDKGAVGFNGSAPLASLTLDGASANGGSSVISADWANGIKGVVPYIIGGLNILAAFALAYFKHIKEAIYAGVAGVAILVATYFDPLLGWCAIAAAGAFLVWRFILTAKQKDDLHEALRAQVDGVSRLDPVAKLEAESHIAAAATGNDIKTINAVKTADGLQ